MLIPMYEPLEVAKYQKCGNVVADPRGIDKNLEEGQVADLKGSGIVGYSFSSNLNTSSNMFVLIFRSLSN